MIDSILHMLFLLLPGAVVGFWFGYWVNYRSVLFVPNNAEVDLEALARGHAVLTIPPMRVFVRLGRFGLVRFHK